MKISIVAERNQANDFSDQLIDNPSRTTYSGCSILHCFRQDSTPGSYSKVFKMLICV